MINTKYSVAIESEKPAYEVFGLLTDLSAWWPEDYVGEEIQAGTEFILRSGEGHFSRNKVIEFVPGKKLAWLTTESLRKADNYDWTGTKMILELFPAGKGTRISYTYDGVVPEQEQDRLAQICDYCIKEKLRDHLESFRTSIETFKSPSEVFECLGEVPDWWSRDFEGRSRDLNDEFIIHHPNTHFSKQKLIEVIPGKKIVWLVTEGTLHWLKQPHEWTNTKMIFQISVKNDKTILDFTHEGLVPAKECYSACINGWTMVIRDRLFHYIQEGKPYDSKTV